MVFLEVWIFFHYSLFSTVHAQIWIPGAHPSCAHAQIQKRSRCSCLCFWRVRNLVGEIPEKSELNLLLKEGKMLNYYVFCQTRKKTLVPWTIEALEPPNMTFQEFLFKKSCPWWSTAWQDLCWKVQGQPWPCDSWPSGSWCDTYLWAVCEIFCQRDDSS